MQLCESRQDCRSSRLGFVGHFLLVMLAVVVAFVSVASVAEGRFGFEKALTGLALPVGFVWLITTTTMICSWLRKWTRLVRFGLTCLWLAFTVITTSPLPDLMFASLEQQLEGEFNPTADQPLDMLVVFGGGTQMGPSRPEVAEAGDRVVYAAQLYHGGNARKLLATGAGADVETLRIWQDLGIERSGIDSIEGRNTFEEITNLCGLLEDQKELKRIGILSSAYHLPRVKRLAEQAGLTNLIPVAAHHRTSSKSYSILDFVPSLGPLAKFTDVQRELMGRLMGR